MTVSSLREDVCEASFEKLLNNFQVNASTLDGKDYTFQYWND